MQRRDFVTLLGSTAITWPLAARAQPPAVRVIGFLGTTLPSLSTTNLAAFRQGLSETGYVEGQNVTVEYRWAEGRYDRLPVLAADLVGRKVDVIVASTTPGILAAKSATATIPIIFMGGDDPVRGSFVASLAQPGGNVTGISIMSAELDPKRLELLHELVPKATVIALLANPANSRTEPMIRNLQEAARARNLQLLTLKASTESEIDAAFATLVQVHAGALNVLSDSFFSSRRDRLVRLAARHAIPAIYEWREFAVAGGLISYGSSYTGAWRQAGVYTGRILMGAKPQQPTKFELVINLKAAKALGIEISASLLARADEVIE
jgi:putative ABC transport system substrate-binding protein